MVKNSCKKFIIGLCSAIMLSTSIMGASVLSQPVVVLAQSSIEDNLSGGNDYSGDVDEMFGNTTISEDDQAVSNWIKGQRGMTSKQLNSATKALSPVTNIMGYIVGAIVALVMAGVFVITGLDLLYITIPPLRNVLYSGGNTRGGMTGGYVGGYGGGRYGMSGYGGATGGGASKPRQWISDEAIQCAAFLDGGQQGAMGNYGPSMQQPQQQSKGSVIGAYFKKRIFFMILLAICIIVLTSSVLLGTGVNLAQWVLKLIEMFNNYIPA